MLRKGETIINNLQKRNLGFICLGLVVGVSAFGGLILNQTMQGIYLVIGTLLMVLVAACLTYVGVKLLTECYNSNSHGGTKQERDSSL
jgi:hypothetical protein